jgi:peptidoglycan/LPS O-acetylase OafA/YrhL
VIVFFVLSGSLVGPAAQAAVRRGELGLAEYAVARIVRLYIVLVPALILGAAIDAVGLAAYGAGYGDGEILVAQRMTLAAFCISAAHLQGILMPPFGSNAPLWSLAYEAWYYVLFPFLLLAFFARSPERQGLAATVFVAGLLAVGSTIALYFTTWLLGALVAAISASTCSIPRRFSCALSCGRGHSGGRRTLCI